MALNFYQVFRSSEPLSVVTCENSDIPRQPFSKTLRRKMHYFNKMAANFLKWLCEGISSTHQECGRYLDNVEYPKYPITTQLDNTVLSLSWPSKSASGMQVFMSKKMQNVSQEFQTPHGANLF